MFVQWHDVQTTKNIPLHIGTIVVTFFSPGFSISTFSRSSSSSSSTHFCLLVSYYIWTNKQKIHHKQPIHKLFFVSVYFTVCRCEFSIVCTQKTSYRILYIISITLQHIKMYLQVLLTCYLVVIFCFVLSLLCFFVYFYMFLFRKIIICSMSMVLLNK